MFLYDFAKTFGVTYVHIRIYDLILWEQFIIKHTLVISLDAELNFLFMDIRRCFWRFVNLVTQAFSHVFTKSIFITIRLKKVGRILCVSATFCNILQMEIRSIKFFLDNLF